MRDITLLTEAYFTKENKPAFSEKTDTASWERVPLPHTWNNLDGQDGGGDYYRGGCWYKLPLPTYKKDRRQFIQFEGANHLAQVWCNGSYLGEHRGGFSTFRFELTEHLCGEEDELSVLVDNGPDSHIYPQQADFTFFGGLYRNVSLIEVPDTHFELLQAGGPGVFISPTVKGNAAELRVDAFVAGGCEAVQLRCRILDTGGVAVAEAVNPASAHSAMTLQLEEARFWQGRRNPYLYTAELTLQNATGALDQLCIPFGLRSFSVDAVKGFFLNGESYPLRGVSRHQDRLNKGWALSRNDHEEDMALIAEVGANTLRLAHYQHDGYFYDLCDQYGMVVWAEIPFISVFDTASEARENTLSQMRELIVQNYNHPSICFWGIANEISIGGDTPELQDNLRVLASLVKELDPSRLSTIAHMSMLPLSSPQQDMTDVLAYNHYFGWYGGSVEENGPWLDNYHSTLPQRPLGLSEYGAECVQGWHSASPKVKDYSEEYQAYYHEQMLQTFSTRPYLWGTYVWNMFDFAADAREEGGSQGRNNKGLVSYDRRLKKDSFYAYKAWWSKEPFVHLAGRRFVNRDGGKTQVKVYSNQPEVSLTVNGESLGICSEGPVFLFEEVPLCTGENLIVATAPCGLGDSITLNGVAQPDESYILPQEDESEAVRNWFESLTTEVTELRFPEGYYSVNDTLGTLMQNPETATIIKEMMTAAMGKAVMKMADNMGGAGGGMMQSFTVDMLLQFAGDKFPPDAKVMLNERLIQIKKG